MIIKKLGVERRDSTQDLSLTDFSKKSNSNEEDKRQDQIQTIIDRVRVV